MVAKVKKDRMSIQLRVASGVRGVKIAKGDELIFAKQVDDEGEFIIITDAAMYKRVVSAEIDTTDRDVKGVKIVELGKTSSTVYAGYVKEPFDIAVIDNFGVAFALNTEDISIEGRTTKGKTLKNENKKRMPEKVFRIF
jgi:DNA gyrase subunit A